MLKIKILDQNDWESWKNIRLESLKNLPSVFVSSFEEVQNEPDEFFKEHIKNNKTYGAFFDNQLVAVVTFRRDRRLKERHRGHLSALYVKPEFSRQGIASRLMSTVIKDAPKIVSQIYVCCVAHNHPSINLCKKLGFKIYGTDTGALKIGSEYYDLHLLCLRIS